MTDHAHEDDTCAPFQIDFDRLAGQVAENETVKERTAGGRKLASVEHTIRHLREETDLEDRQIAKVLLTTSVLFTDLLQIDREWNPIFFANLLALCGQRLWHDGTPAPAAADPDAASQWWAVWEPDKRLRAIEEYTQPQTADDVLAALHAQENFRPCELMPLTKAWAGRLRQLLEFGAAARAEALHPQIAPEHAS